MSFDGINDVVNIYCPKCDEDSMKVVKVSKNVLRELCEKCGLERTVYLMDGKETSSFYNRPLTDKEIQRLYWRRE